MPIIVTCKKCAATMNLPDSAAGAKGYCIACGTPFVADDPRLKSGVEVFNFANKTTLPSPPLSPSPPPASAIPDEPLRLLDDDDDHGYLQSSHKPEEPSSEEVGICAECDIVFTVSKLQIRGGRPYCQKCFSKAATPPKKPSSSPAPMVSSPDSTDTDVCSLCGTLHETRNLHPIHDKLICPACKKMLIQNARKRNARKTGNRTRSAPAQAPSSSQETKFVPIPAPSAPDDDVEVIADFCEKCGALHPVENLRDHQGRRICNECRGHA